MGVTSLPAQEGLEIYAYLRPNKNHWLFQSYFLWRHHTPPSLDEPGTIQVGNEDLVDKLVLGNGLYKGHPLLP